MPRNALALAAVLAAAVSSQAFADEPLRLATFNIHHAEGSDGKLDVARVADAVRSADVVAFQEVDVKFRERSRFADQAALLGKALGGSVAFGGNLIEGEGRYGVAVVSRFPIVSSQNHPLPRAPGREKAEPRGVLETRIDAPGGRLRVFATHLAHDSAADRALQVAALRALVANGSGPAVVLGDLNFRPTDAPYSTLLAPPEGKDAPLLVDAWPKVGKGDGFTIGTGGERPGRIDYILVTPDLAPRLESARVDTETPASDHQPLFVTLKPAAAKP